jgi:hypothetical protein
MVDNPDITQFLGYYRLGGHSARISNVRRFRLDFYGAHRSRGAGGSSPRAVEDGASLAIFDPKQISISIAFYLHLPSTENARSTFPGIPPHCP